MADWQSKLYEAYVSTGQSTAGGDAGPMRLSDYPQYVDLIRRYLPKDRGIRIADLACGHGALIFCLREMGYRNVEGIDISPEQVALAHRRGIHEVGEGNIAGHLAGKDKTYDVVLLMDILEHLDEPSVMNVLQLVSGSLRDQGMAVIHVPNAEGRFGMRIRYGDFTHRLCFTPQSMRQVLSATGLTGVEIYEDKPVVHGIRSLVRRVLWDVLTLPDRLLLLAETGASGHVLSQNMLVVARKHP